MGWMRDIGRKVTGAEARDREARAHQILQEHEARDHFGAQEALDRLTAEMPDDHAKRFILQHIRGKIEPVIFAALEDGIISPEEDARIERVRERYGNIQLEGAIIGQLEAARAQYLAWSTPLEPVQVPLMLKKSEWCAHAVKSAAYEERQRTVRTNYTGPTARVRIMKGVYYRAGSIQTQRVTESYQHSFGDGVLGATNTRLLWVSPQKSLSIPLDKIVMFEPFIDGIKIIKDAGKPILFVFEGPDQASMVRISRVIEELR
jgi:hypothetical protein